MQIKVSVSWPVLGLIALAAGLIAVAVAELGPPSAKARTETTTITAEKGVVQTTVTGSGNVEAAVDDDVDFQTSGTLKHVYVKVGQHVAKGQLLATLDDSSAETALQEAKDTLTAAKAQLASAESAASTDATTSASSTSTTSATTAASGSSSGSSSESTVAAEKAQVLTDRANVTSARQALADTRLYAPVGGTIVSLQATEPGASISSSGSSSSSSSASSSSTSSSSSGSSTAGALGGSDTTSSSTTTDFAEIINKRRLTMTVPFDESDISKIKVGQAATVTLEALSGVELAAKVTALSPLATTSSSVVSYDATLTLTQNNTKVLPGMSAEASVVTGQASGVTLPSDAITESGAGNTVTLVKNGKTTQQAVAVGLKGDTRTLIVSGLAAGDEVEVTTQVASSSSANSSSAGSSSSSSGTLGGSSSGTSGFGSSALGGAGGGPPSR